MTIFDLLPQTTDIANFVPDEVVEQIGLLTILEHASTRSDDFILHSGVLQSIGDILGIDAENASIKIPGLTQGLPFRLAIGRGTTLANGQEGLPVDWTLDVLVSNVELLLPGLQGARQAGGTGVNVLHLEKLDPPRDVFLVASGVLRVEGAAGRTSAIQLVDNPDPFDPTVPTGAVVRLTVRPPDFFLFGSRYGMTLSRFAIDRSKTFTPADIVARGHDESWQGVSFKEATFYTPPNFPLLPSLSISARDVIVGDPRGRQGELRVEWGADFADQANAHLTVLRKPKSGDDVEVERTNTASITPVLEYGIDESIATLTNQARVRFGIGDAIPGHTDLGVVGVWWELPDGRQGNDGTTPYFTVPTETALRYKLRLGDPGASFPRTNLATAVPEGQTELIEVAVRFARIGAPKPAAPIIDAKIGNVTFRNVVHLRGARGSLKDIVLTARRDGNPVESRWILGSGSAPVTANKKTQLKLPQLPDRVGICDLVVTAESVPRRVRIEVVKTGPLAVGHQTGTDATATGAVSDAAGNVVAPTEVTDTLDAGVFHETGDQSAAAATALLAPPHVTVPSGTIAEVTLPIPTDAAKPITSQPAEAHILEDKALQIRYIFGTAVPVVDAVTYPFRVDLAEKYEGENDHQLEALPLALKPSNRPRPDGDDNDQRIRTWVNLPGASAQRKYLIVGRTDDLAENRKLADNHLYNDGLARERLDDAKRRLIAAGIADDAILGWIESEDPPILPAEFTGQVVPARFQTKGRLAFPLARLKKPPGKIRPVWNSAFNDDGADPATHYTASHDPRRQGYRCSDIYALDPPSTPVPAPPPSDGVPTRMLVPGSDGPQPPKIPSTEASSPPIDYRVRLRVKWDSPTIVNSADLIPTECEILVAWKAAQKELPATASSGGTAGTVIIPKPTGPDFWELILRLAYDARTEQTQLDGSLSLPDGTMTFRSNPLAGAMAFGPAFLALVDPADVQDGFTDDAGEKLVAAAAILAAGAIVGDLLNSDGDPESLVDIDKFAISYRWDGDSRVSATVDYTVDLRVNVNLPGGSVLEGNIKLRYKGVGLRFDPSESGLASVGITYDGLSVEVADPGQWSFGGPLGNLIRIAASRIGNGSTWMEFDLEFALDLGVVRLEGATIRMTLAPFSVELRGLTAVIDVPKVLKGKGSVTLGEAGAIRALLGVQVIPARLGAYGALAIDNDFVAVEIGVQFPVGIPLANTGLGLFGLMGRFVANGARNLDGLTSADPVQRELDWYARSPEQKYARTPGQFAIGLGAVIGTLPDSAFTFNAEGSIAIGFPNISVLLGIDAHLLTERKQNATESAPTTTSSMRILGMTLFDPQAVMIAVRATYEIPKVVRVNIPFSAYYPLASSGLAWFIRLGADNHPDRPGSPITVTLFPELLDLKAWAFLMIEERQLHGLGGTLVPASMLPPLDFDGFSIGMGAGFELRKKAGPFKLELAAWLLLGLGTKPMLFAGAAGVRGELDLRVASVGVDGVVHFYITDDLQYVHGHFCGHVDCFFFSVGGCVDIDIGDPIPSDIPKPDSPLIGIDLCDHLAAVKSSASRDPASPPVVWPDTVAVMKFQHYVQDALGDVPATDFRRLLPPSAVLSAWSGSTELKYAFRLEQVELFRLTGGDPNSDGSWAKVGGPFDSAWWLPSHRSATVVGGNQPPPSTEEGRELGLFHWDPRTWSRWLGDGSQDLPGDPAGSVGTVCEQPAEADPSCVLGEQARGQLGALAGFDAVVPPDAVFPSRFSAAAFSGAGYDPASIATLAGDAGWIYRSPAIDSLHGPVNYHGQLISRGWRLPSLWEASHFVVSVPTGFRFTKPLIRGNILFEICVARRRVGPKPPRAWDRMPREAVAMLRFGGGSGARYSSEKPMQPVEVDGRPALILTETTTGEHGAAVDMVQVELATDHEVEITAFNLAGDEVATAKIGPQSHGERPSGVATLQAEGIVRVAINPAGPSNLLTVRWGGEDATLAGEVSQLPEPDLPVVVGVTQSGERVPLTPQLVMVVDPGANTCFKFDYALEDRGADAGQGWVAVEVPAHRRGEVALVSLCGVTLEAQQAHGMDEDFRGELIELLGGLFGHLSTNEPTRTIQLDPATTYQVRSTWSYQGFRPANPGDAPGPPNPSQWIDGGVDRFTFRTAEFGICAPPAPAASASLGTDPAQGGPGYDERVFDPRGLARYIMAVTPDHHGAPHFLDDRIGFWFSVDHISSLVDHYDRVPLVKVLRTDPGPAALHDVPPPPAGGEHPLDVTVATHFRVEALTWFDADHRFVVAAEEAPCIGGAPPLGSSSISVDADLKPRSDYDLMFSVDPKTVGAHPEVIVARTHFRTSRYRGPVEMLRALGFRDPVGFGHPFDAIATAGLPLAGPAEVGDATLDDLMKQLGLDPWPLPAGPRTSLIWSRPTSPTDPWIVLGAIIEGDEPVVRPGFRTGAAGEAVPPARVEIASLVLHKTVEVTLTTEPPEVVTSSSELGALTERVRNAAGTRVLFLASAPIPVTGGVVYEMVMRLRERGLDGASGMLTFYDRPVILFQEGE